MFFIMDEWHFGKSVGEPDLRLHLHELSIDEICQDLGQHHHHFLKAKHFLGEICQDLG